MTTLRVILDPMVGPPSSGGRYAERLTRALIGYAPEGSAIAGVISAIPDEDAAALERDLAGLRTLHRTRLARRELRAAWQHGITLVPGTGLLHATDLAAPLGRHDRRVDADSQIVVTVSDTVAWTRPEALVAREASRRRALGARAARYADAFVVPTHAVADAVGEHLGVTDRVRVIAGAARPGASRAAAPEPTQAPAADVRGLPARYVAMVLPDDAALPSETIASILDALPDDVAIVVATPATDPAAVGPSELAAVGRVTFLPAPGDVELGALLSGASALVDAGPELGFGLHVLEAIAAGTPVVHLTGPDADELLAGAGVAVDTPDDLGDATRALLEDSGLADRHATLGRDRAHAFSWRDTAEKIWQLHADL